jgi:hypothetical protein
MSTITFGVSDYSGLSLFLDDISVVDSVNPFVELLNNSSFENSTTTLTGWNMLCSSTCGAGGAGRINSGGNCLSSNNCYRDQCDSPNVDFLVQTFPTVSNHVYSISFWFQFVQLNSQSGFLYFYVDII